MAKSRSDDDGFEEKPRPRSQGRPVKRSEDDYEEDDRPARRSRPAARRHEEDEEDDRPRRKRSRDGAMSGIIPYRNVLALVAYYCGFGSLIAILGGIAIAMATIGGRNSPILIFILIGVGGLLALLGIILGILGLTYVGKHPEAKGTGHAITGIIMGSLEIIGLIAVSILFGAAWFHLR
jgi:hypothetical protein